MLSHGDLDIRIGCDTEQSLPDGYRLLLGIKPDGEHLLRSFELTYEATELTLLLLARLCSRRQLARRLGSLIHERRVGLTNCDHRPNLSLSPRPAWDQVADCFDGMGPTIRLPRDVPAGRFESDRGVGSDSSAGSNLVSLRGSRAGSWYARHCQPSRARLRERPCRALFHDFGRPGPWCSRCCRYEGGRRQGDRVG
jgi:hypothetical protein